MKLLLILICCPLLTIAQSPGRPDDSLRKASDTMHFPVPFVFKATARSGFSGTALFSKCYNWIVSVKDSLKGIELASDTAHGKITAVNVPATADITCTLVIAVKGNTYSCSLQEYVYHTINGATIPIKKAVTMKEYKETTNIEKVIIMRNYPLIFASLHAFVEKGNSH